MVFTGIDPPPYEPFQIVKLNRQLWLSFMIPSDFGHHRPKKEPEPTPAGGSPRAERLTALPGLGPERSG